MIGLLIAAASQFCFMALAIGVTDRCGPSNEMHRHSQPKKAKIKRFTYPLLQARLSTLVLKVCVSYIWKMAKCVASYTVAIAKED